MHGYCTLVYFTLCYEFRITATLLYPRIHHENQRVLLISTISVYVN